MTWGFACTRRSQASVPLVNIALALQVHLDRGQLGLPSKSQGQRIRQKRAQLLGTLELLNTRIHHRSSVVLGAIYADAAICWGWLHDVLSI